jgi:L-seryl-tRNA(Ser) seleniumtransferase
MAARKKSPLQENSDRRSQMLRSLPSVDECLRAADRDPALSAFSHGYLRVLVRQALTTLRDQAQASLKGNSSKAANEFAATRDSMVEEILRMARAAASADEPSMRTVVNATGIVLHTNLGRALIAESAIEAMVRAARSPVNLEYDLWTGGRGDRDSLIEEELCALTGAEAATVVNNNAAAVLLALNSIADGREVIVSRGELIEIGGSFRIPDVMSRSGTRLREVGTTNRTHPRDYVAAINPDTAMLLKVHPSNYRIVGFTAEVSLAEMVEIGNAHKLPVMEDLGAGALVDMAAYGLPREPIVADRIAAGAAIVTFSGDKLLGGPQAGLIVGRREFIERLKANPLKRALRCDKITLAALEATLRLYLRSPDFASEVPTLRQLRRTPAELETFASRAREILTERLGADFMIEVVVSASEIGSGALPTEEIESRALRITHGEISPDAIAKMFRYARPPVIGRITDGGFQLDLRTIEDPAALAVELPVSKPG